MAEMLAFPLNRRVGLIRRQAALYNAYATKGAERNLAYQLEIQRNSLLGKGLPSELVEAEVTALETIIRSHAGCRIVASNPSSENEGA